MNKIRLYTLLALLLMAGGATMQAQEIIVTGVVSRVDAPYFEQNVCNDRFAIVSEGETYYVMVDNYWPNPYLEDLVIHYDTIPVGNEIEVKGTVVEMEDGNGEIFQAIDISENLNSTYQQILGFFDNDEGACFYHYIDLFYGLEEYHITINGELQTTPFAINGRTLVEEKRYLFVGISGEGVFELFDALPYEVEDVSISGWLTLENDLCLSSPCGETHFLSLFDGEEYHYLTQKRKLQNNYVNEAVFMEGNSVMVGGFEFVRHDLFGNPFKALEIIEMQSIESHPLIGGMGTAGIPWINLGPPVPGVDLAFQSDGIYYYIMNPHNDDFLSGFYIVGNDTIPVTWQQLTATCTPSMFINNYLNPFYRVNIEKVEFEEHEETLQCTLVVENNPFYFGEMLAINTQENETYYLKPYIYTFTAPDHITIGDNTAYVGDSFIATGMVSNWYNNNASLEKAIDITEISNITGVIESTPTNLMVYPNPTDGIFRIEGVIANEVQVYNALGQLVKTVRGTNEVDLSGLVDGVYLVRIADAEGKVYTNKITVQ